MAELRLTGLGNELVQGIMRVELQLITWGLRFPAGGGHVDHGPERRETSMTTNNAESGHTAFLGPILRALFFILLIALLLSGKGALQGTHWDAPIYLFNGKELATTPLLGDYARHASEIAARLPEFKSGVDTRTQASCSVRPVWSCRRIPLFQRDN
jgi:hypothetical protein